MSKASQDPRNALSSMVAFLGLAAIVGYTVLAARFGIAFAVPVGVIGLIGGTIALRGPLGQGLLGRAEPTGAEESAARLLAEVDDLRVRMQELEERVDFSERLLTDRSRAPDARTGD